MVSRIFKQNFIPLLRQITKYLFSYLETGHSYAI